MAGSLRDGHRAPVLGVMILTLLGALGLAGVVLVETEPPSALTPNNRTGPPHPDGPIAPGSNVEGGPSREVVSARPDGEDVEGKPSNPEGLPAVSVEVVGVSGALVPHLVMVFQPVGDRTQWDAVPCDESGVATLRGQLPERMQLGLFQALVSDVRMQDAVDGSFTWDVEPGARLQARPAEPIAGVRRATRADGITPPLKLAFSPEQEIGPAREVQIVRRAHLEAAEWLYLWSEDTGGFRMRPEDLLRATEDLWLADPAAGERLARLRLVVPEDRVADAQRMKVLLRAGDGGESVYLRLGEKDRWEGGAFLADRIPAGTWRAEWRSGARSCGVLAEELVLRSGQEAVLAGEPPGMIRWRGEVANWDDVPEPVRTRHDLFVAGTLAAVDDDGRFEVELPADLLPAELQVEFRGESSARRLPGRLVSYDPNAGTLVVEHPPVADFGVVQVTVQPALPDSRRSIVVLRGLDRRAPALHRAAWYFHGGYRVAVENGAVELPRWEAGPLTGALVEVAGGESQVTAWFSVPQGAARHTVRGAGRWATLHLHREAARAQVYVQGPMDQPALFVAEMQGPGELPVWTVPGTGAVVVDLGGGEVQRLSMRGSELHVW